MNAKQSQNAARIPKPWTLKAAFLIIDGTCLLLALICICDAIWNSSPSPLAGLAFPVAFLFCPALVMRGGNSLMRIFFFAIAFLVLLPCFIASQFDWKMILTLPFVALPVLLYMPPSGRWFAAVRQEQGKRPHPLLRELCFGCFTMLLLAFGLLAIFVLIPDIPYMRNRWRYPAMQKDELVAAAGKKEVKRVFAFSQGGTNFTVVVIGHMRWLASGPGVFVFDEQGRRIDHTIDYGDNPSFRERWNFSWADFRQTNAVGHAATQVEQERDKWRAKWDARMGSTFTVGCVNCGAFHYNKGLATTEEFAAAWGKLAADWPQDAFFYEDVGKREIGELAVPKFDIRAAAKRAPGSTDVVELPRAIESSVGEQRTRRYRALRLTYDLGGKKLAVYGMHLVANDHVREPKTAKGEPSLSQKLRRRQFEALIEDARKFDFAILTGDFNAQAAWEYDVFVKAGFSIGNCSEAYGTKATLRNIPADNIILSPGLSFADFRVLDGYVLNTDHLPLVATVRLDR